MNPQLIFAVAVGGALGSVTRYLVAGMAGRMFGAGLPHGTLIINVTGSFLIGTFIGIFAKWDLSQAARAFLVVGVCGGYTTFSTFSLDVWHLFERGETMTMFAYMVASVLLSVGALVAGIHLIRTML